MTGYAEWLKIVLSVHPDHAQFAGQLPSLGVLADAWAVRHIMQSLAFFSNTMCYKQAQQASSRHSMSDIPYVL